MVSDSRLEDLFEGVVDPSPHPAVNVNVLHSKPDFLFCEVLILEKEMRSEKLRCG